VFSHLYVTLSEAKGLKHLEILRYAQNDSKVNDYNNFKTSSAVCASNLL